MSVNFLITTMSVSKNPNGVEKETIHSGHFMVSHFEAEAQDELDELAVPVPDEDQNVQRVSVVTTYSLPVSSKTLSQSEAQLKKPQLLSIEVSLTKLFKCMTLAYRQKLTSPKWNRFKGIKLRWKDKIRLNNVIWRCWHMQFIKKKNTLVCQFASPLDVDIHVKPETTILEGKYWKRRAEAVTAEYKKWRMFHIMRPCGKEEPSARVAVQDMDTTDISQFSELGDKMLTDEDYLNFMSDTLFSTITYHQPFAFPDPREIARGANIADFIQPSLGPLQPNLDDFMDTLEPLHELLSTPRLQSVPEEPTIISDEPMYRRDISLDCYGAENLILNNSMMPTAMTTNQGNQNQSQLIKNEKMQYCDNSSIYAQTDLQNSSLNQANVLSAYASLQTASEGIDYSKAPRVVNAGTNKHDATYKNITALTPSQSAPKTVSLLQQPVQFPKHAPTTLVQGRTPYTRERSKLPTNQYRSQSKSFQNYGVNMISQAGQSLTVQKYESPELPRQNPPEYFQAAPNTYKSSGHSEVQSFKMPTSPAMFCGSGRDSFRSHSLPLGAKIEPPADWPPPPREHSHHAHLQRRASGAGSDHRPRARSSSGGAGSAAGGVARGAGEGARALSAAASEPSLPNSSAMLAHLLSAHYSQGGSGAGGEEAEGSLASPGGSDVTSSHHSLSPPVSPASPRSAGSPRRTHLHAEQKRRYNIKNGFDTLHVLIPSLAANASNKTSKAAMLQKAAEYIKQLKSERNQIKEEMESLRQQIECLNNSISNCHALLPATGAPVSRARAGRLRDMFAAHVAARAQQDWKYWLLSVVCGGLVESFSASVSCGGRSELARTTLLWADQHCALAEMRPAVLNSLRSLCTSTDFLAHPERLPEEARAAAALAARPLHAPLNAAHSPYTKHEPSADQPL